MENTEYEVVDIGKNMFKIDLKKKEEPIVEKPKEEIKVEKKEEPKSPAPESYKGSTPENPNKKFYIVLGAGFGLLILILLFTLAFKFVGTIEDKDFAPKVENHAPEINQSNNYEITAPINNTFQNNQTNIINIHLDGELASLFGNLTKDVTAIKSKLNISA